MWRSPYKAKILNLPFCWISPPPENWVSVFLPWPQTTYWRKTIITFRPTLPTTLPVMYIFSYTIITSLKKFIETKSVNTKRCQQDYLPVLYPITPLNLYEKPWRWGRILGNSEKIYLFSPSEKSSLINLHLLRSKVSFLPRQIVIFI